MTVVDAAFVAGRGTVLKAGQTNRGAADVAVRETVAAILADVRADGLDAVRRTSERLDGWNPADFRVSADEIAAARAAVDPEIRRHIEFAHERVVDFARHQRRCLLPLDVEAHEGVHLGHRLVPVRSVGCYVPGGRYPLIASALMSIATATVAEVPRIVACAPPRAGGIDPVQLFAMDLAGAHEIYAVGGVQALAAMAYGVEGFGPSVDMLVGPGNAYVAEAKRELFGTVGIDLLAGPTEVLVIADETADARLVATDLLGQAEHGANSPAWLVTTDAALGQAVAEQVETLLEDWPTAEVAGAAWREHGAIVVCDGVEQALSVCDDLAAEHVEIQTADPQWWLEHLSNYGTMFVGHDSTVTYSDKAIGTNHTLPTGRAARYTGGLWVGSYIKVLTYQRVHGPDATRWVAPSAAAVARAEGMIGHAITAEVRLAAADASLTTVIQEGRS